MKTKFAIPLVSFLVLATPLTWGPGIVAQPPKPDAANALSKEDEQAIRKTIAGIEEAWNAHDMKAYGKLFQPDAHFVNVVGMHWRGRDAVMAAHIAFHETSFKNHSIKTDTVETRSLGGGHAIAVVTTTNDAFTTPSGQVIPKRQNRQTYVLGQSTDGWKIAHGHNVAVDPAAAPFDPVNAPKTNR